MAENQDKDQKTEEATPRRLQEAREEGQVALSSEFVAAIGLLVGGAAMMFGGGQLMQAIGEAIHDTARAIRAAATTELSLQGAAEILEGRLRGIAWPLALVVGPGVLALAIAGYGQVGLQFTSKAVEIKPDRLDPVQGMSRLFGLRSLVRTAMAAAKVVAIAATVAVVAYWHVDEVIRMGSAELGPLLVGVGTIAFRCALAALLAILALSLIDLLYQRYQHRRDLRMSKQEIKEEHRLTEGDPHLKARIRQQQREMATRRMMADVPRSTVVVTNPTHYAVALRYDPDWSQRAPVVVAKGADFLARRIKEVAAEAGVARYEDVALARSLYARVEIGEEVPEELYSAVAVVIGYVLRLRQAVRA